MSINVIEVFVMIVHLMDASGEIEKRGVGPFPSMEACETTAEQIIELAEARSESHALVLHCRQATPAEIQQLKELRNGRGHDPNRTDTTGAHEIPPIYEFPVVDSGIRTDGSG